MYHAAIRPRRDCVANIPVIVALLSACVAFNVAAGEDDPADSTSTQQRHAELIAKRNELGSQANAYLRQGQWADAISTGEELFAVYRQLPRAEREKRLNWTNWLAARYEQRENWNAARDLRREALELATETHGPHHWTVIDARLASQGLELRAALTEAQRKELAAADALAHGASADTW